MPVIRNWKGEIIKLPSGAGILSGELDRKNGENLGKVTAVAKRITVNKVMVDNLYSEGSQVAAQALKDLETMQVIGANRKEILARIAVRMKPDVRHELGISYARSGLRTHGKFNENAPSRAGDKPGAMYNAMTKDVVIEANARGIVCKLPQNLNKQVYERAGIFQFGGVIGIGKTKGKAQRHAKRKILAGQGGKSVTLGGGVRTVAATNVFGFVADQIDRLTLKFAEYWKDEVSKLGK
jgi:hypothetical protein